MTATFRYHLPARGGVDLNVHFVVAEQTVQQRYVEVLTAAAVGAVKQGGDYGAVGVGTGGNVTKSHAGQRGWPVDLSGHTHNPRVGLPDVVKAWQLGQWTFLAEAGD